MNKINEINKWVKENIDKRFEPSVISENKIKLDLDVFTDDEFEYRRVIEFKDIKDLEQKLSRYLIKNNNYIRDSWWKNLGIHVDNGGENNEEFQMGYEKGVFYVKAHHVDDYSNQVIFKNRLENVWKFLDDKYGKGKWEEDWWVDFVMCDYGVEVKTYMEYEKAFKVLSTFQHLLEFFKIKSEDDDYNETYKLEEFELVFPKKEEKNVIKN